MTLRCKRIKPGDGGPVDGCGWQGEVEQLDYNASESGSCPACGSALLYTTADTGHYAALMANAYRDQRRLLGAARKKTMKPGYEPKHLLGEMGQICEEAGDVLKHFGKILRFGIDNVYYPHETNRQAFYRELDDLEACIKRIKARHAANPEEALGPVTDEQHSSYIKLAQAMNSYFIKLDEAGINPAAAAKGVRRRGDMRKLQEQLNVLVSRALGTCTCKHGFAHDKDCPFWPNVRDA